MTLLTHDVNTVPSVVSLPQRKKDFTSLIKNMSEMFTQLSDDDTLGNIAQSLTFLASGDHSRATDVQVQLERLTLKLTSRLEDLFAGDEESTVTSTKKRAKSSRKDSRSNKRRKTSESSTATTDIEDNKEDESPAMSLEHSIYLCMKRLKILALRADVTKILNDGTGKHDIDTVRNIVVHGIESRLKERRMIREESTQDDETVHTIATIPEIWKMEDKKLTHGVIVGTIDEALGFLLTTTGWELKRAKEKDPVIQGKADADEDEDLSDHVVVKYRQQMENLILLCFELSLPEPDDDEEYSEEQIVFSDRIQSIAARVQCDLRTLFPKKWVDAKSPLLRACALTQDILLVGGFLRYFQGREQFLRDCENEDEDEDDEVVRLLLPFVRNLSVNWKHCNRKEAGHALMHFIGSGLQAKTLLTTWGKHVKKVDPVRWLETHMAGLQSAFENYLNSQPTEPESDRPSDEEMAAFADAEEAYKEKFVLLENLAARLSQSLGVGKLNDKRLEKPFPGFIREGVRFAFSSNTPDGEEDFLPGGRLLFLRLISKYTNWIKKNAPFRRKLIEDIQAREAELSNDPEFDPVPEDVEALDNFKKCITLKEPKRQLETPNSLISQQSDDEGSIHDDTSTVGATPGTLTTPVSRRSTYSRGSSIGTNRSVISALSPLPEEGDSESGSPDSSPHNKRRKMSRVSVDSNITMSTFGTKRGDGKSQEETIDEGSETESSGDEETAG